MTSTAIVDKDQHMECTTFTDTITHRDGTTQPRRRKLLSGQTRPLTIARTWQDHVAPGPLPTGGQSAQPDHPSFRFRTSAPDRVLADIKHDSSGTRRRDRRTVARRLTKIDAAVTA